MILIMFLQVNFKSTLNDELKNVSLWLNTNTLPLNNKKMNDVIFHSSPKKVPFSPQIYTNKKRKLT